MGHGPEIQWKDTAKQKNRIKKLFIKVNGLRSRLDEQWEVMELDLINYGDWEQENEATWNDITLWDLGETERNMAGWEGLYWQEDPEY